MQWYYGVGNEVCGPVENDGLVDLVRSGEVRQETPVWASYLGNWTPAGRIDGLFATAGVAPNATAQPEPVLAGQGAAPSEKVAQHPTGGGQTLPAARSDAPGGDRPSGGADSAVAESSPSKWESASEKPVTVEIGSREHPKEPSPGANPAGETKVESPALEAPVDGVPLAAPPGGVTLNPGGIPLPGSEPSPQSAASQSPAASPGSSPLPATESPAQPAAGSGVTLNPGGIPLPGSETPAEPTAREGEIVNPGGIPVPETGKISTGTFSSDGKPEPVDEGFHALAPRSSQPNAPTSEFAPVRGSSTGTGKGEAIKKWGVMGLVSLVLLAGGAALADKFVLGGKLFGLGAKATGPHRYVPDSPRFAFNVEIRSLLLNPTIAGKLDEGGAMNMIDQMMHSAVGLRPYDIEDVQVLGTDLSMGDPRFVCIINTTKKIPEKLLVEKLFGSEKPTRIRGRNIYELPMMAGGDAVGCIADETTFLLGGRDDIAAVLERTKDPEFSEEELEIVRAATESPAILSLSFDGEMLSKLSEFQGSLPGPATAVQGGMYGEKYMKSAKSISMFMDVKDKFEVDYRIEYATEAEAKAAVEGMEREFGEMDESAFAAQLVAGGADPSAINTKMIEQIMGAMAFSQDGSAAVMHFAMGIEFFESAVGQSMGTVGPF